MAKLRSVITGRVIEIPDEPEAPDAELVDALTKAFRIPEIAQALATREARLKPKPWTEGDADRRTQRAQAVTLNQPAPEQITGDAAAQGMPKEFDVRVVEVDGNADLRRAIVKTDTYRYDVRALVRSAAGRVLRWDVKQEKLN
jgi:hypothetical protein